MCDFNEQQRDAIDYVATHGTIAAGLRIAELQAKVDKLTHSIFQYGIENSRLQLQRDALEEWKEENGGIE
jgi:hypothetical protein